jgi:transglutaminase-like putative cysteine protease
VLRTIALSALAGLVIAVDWLRFEDPRSSGERPAVLVALAIAPVLVRPLWPRVAAVLVSAVLAAWVAFSVSPADLWPGGDGYFGPLGSRFGGGFVDFYEFQLPIDPARQPHMHQVILAAIFGFVLATALAIAARRVVLAVVCFLVGAGWPATLLAGGNELGRGLVILAVALVLLAGLSGRLNRTTLVAAAAVLVGAFALSTSAAVAKDAFLDWQHWDFYTRPQKPVSVGYIWDARYGGVRFPKKRTTVLMIRAPRTPQYWRATVLDQFDGTRWREDLWRETATESHELVPDAARDRDNWIEQDVTVGALADHHLVGASIPLGWNVSPPVFYAGQNVIWVVDGLHRDLHYTVTSYSARPTPPQLVRSEPDYPGALTKPGRELDVARGVTVPPFGVPGRDERVLRLLRGRLEPYAEVFKRANGVAGQTTSPYAVAVALERWFRVTGGFTYSDRPGSTPGVPPLVGFLVDTRTGYCQHFAGSMALMLRLLGIPARVAAGFVPGHYRDGVWRVTDHDAHAWVEVWFRGYGWLPFDPTPGRGRLSGTYSSTSSGFNPAAAARLLAGIVKGGEVFGAGTGSGIVAHDPQRRTPRSAADLPVRGLGAPPPEEKSTPSLLFFVLLLCAGIAAAIVLVKHARRRLRYITRDPRRIAAACARELGEYLQDQRFPSTQSTTFHELGAELSERLGVDSSGFTDAATTARYGRPEHAPAAARRARTELRELKRKLRRNLFILDRARGLVSVRSLGLG